MINICLFEAVNRETDRNRVHMYDLSGDSLMADIEDTIAEANPSIVHLDRGKPNERRTYRKSLPSKRSGANLESIPESEEGSPLKNKVADNVDVEEGRDCGSDCSQMSEVLNKIDDIIDKTFDSMIEDITSWTQESLQYHNSSDSE